MVQGFEHFVHFVIYEEPVAEPELRWLVPMVSSNSIDPADFQFGTKSETVQTKRTALPCKPAARIEAGLLIWVGNL